MIFFFILKSQKIFTRADSCWESWRKDEDVLLLVNQGRAKGGQNFNQGKVMGGKYWLPGEEWEELQNCQYADLPLWLSCMCNHQGQGWWGGRSWKRLKSEGMHILFWDHYFSANKSIILINDYYWVCLSKMDEYYWPFLISWINK